MGQHEVIEWLARQRLTGDESFFSVREIQTGVNHDASLASVYFSVDRLIENGFLEVDGDRFRRKFRIKIENCEAFL